MPSNAYAALNTSFSVGTGTGPITYTKVAKVENLDGPKLSKDTAETTNYDSAGWKEFEGTLLSGTIDLTLIWTAETTQLGLLTQFTSANDPQPFQIGFPAGMTTAKWSCMGIVTKYELKSDKKDVYRASLSIQLSGVQTYA